MDNLHSNAKNGTLARSSLDEHLVSQLIDDTDDYGDTALFLAIRGGHVGAVKLLLQRGADANRTTEDGKTPLYLATQAPANSGPGRAIGGYPLIAAVRQGTSPEAISALLDAGASLTKPNRIGETPRSLANKSTNSAIHKAISPKDQRPDWKPELENWLVSSGLFALAYFSNWSDVGKNAIDRISALSKYPQKDVDSPRTAEDFEHNLGNYVSGNGLEDFFPKGNDYIPQVAERAAEILRDGTVPGATPENVTIMSRQALYQPIFYCDDSGSMKTDDRMNRQSIMVQRMADLITKAAPNGRVHLRFINKTDGQANNLRPSDLPDKMNFTPDGSTRLGTNLKSKIVQEFLYDPVDRGFELRRPLLILTITDGCPNEEDKDTFANVIEESMKYLASNGYGPQAIRYDLSQIGNAPEATGFLESWQQHPLVPVPLFVTAEHLDAQFENLRTNDADLNTWLLARLDAKNKPRY
ncbi:hypothetical protein N7457_006338 [Penicillium paradoxum]|uniref:uncharacterized protein n=1 Tax=Penicillium paradoxum TaxID=176176 RepID=UPI002548294A|nr:uncharacterized protein N7457_006338 [Penicillium paradoxum]KAJ5781178.1 hypothetical protein N7457_006338 [Penicillium paradoxum]